MSKNCLIGISCGASCVSRSYSCSRDLGEEEADFLSRLRHNLRDTTLSDSPEMKDIVSSDEDLRDVLENGEEIGGGAYGVVFVKDDLAVKLFRYGDSRSGYGTKKEEELEIAKEAGEIGVGPKIIKEYRNEKGGLEAIMMERVKGKMLEEVVSDEGEGVSRKEAEVANNFFKQVGIMHKAGIVHRDLHNENVIVKEDNSVVLIDWGMAEKVDKNRKGIQSVADELSDLLSYEESGWLFPNHRYLSQSSSAMVLLTDNVIRQNPTIYSRTQEAPDYEGTVAALYDGVL